MKSTRLLPLRSSWKAQVARLIGGGVIAILAMTSLASAQTITIYSTSGTADTLPTNIPFSLLNLGTSSSAQFVTSSTLTATSTPPIPSGTEISSIAFGAGTGTGTTPSGVFAGGVSGDGASPYGTTNTTTNYLVAGGGGGTITVTYTVAQDALQILWGSVDNTTTSNVITFKSSTGSTVATVDGAQIASAIGSNFTTGTTNVALRLSGIAPFTSIVLSDANSAAFELALAKPVPEPATIALFGLAVFGVGFVRRRGKTA